MWGAPHQRWDGDDPSPGKKKNMGFNPRKTIGKYKKNMDVMGFIADLGPWIGKKLAYFMLSKALSYRSDFIRHCFQVMSVAAYHPQIVCLGGNPKDHMIVTWIVCFSVKLWMVAKSCTRQGNYW